MEELLEILVALTVIVLTAMALGLVGALFLANRDCEPGDDVDLQAAVYTVG
jgi:hypothetical protein